LGLREGGALQREEDGEGGAFADRAGDVDAAVVVFDNAGQGVRSALARSDAKPFTTYTP